MALKGSMYELLAVLGQQLLRIGGNLVLTRLLFPEAFGLSALVVIFNQGLSLLTDIGILPSVVQSTQGDDQDFLDTAWTLLVIRGLTLCVVGVLVAWPVAALYGEPQLGPLLAVGSLVTLFAGLNSTSLLTLRRQVDARRLMIVNISSRAIGLCVMIVVAWYTRSVWALIVGSIVSAAALTVQSHMIDVGYRNRFRYSKEAAEAIVKFGRWIFLAGALTFVAQQTDRLLLGKLLGMKELGIYTVAVTFSELGNMVQQRLTRQIFFPVFAKVNRDEPTRLREIYYRTRLALDAALMPAAGIGCVIVPFLIMVLYDPRYEAAGWMAQILVTRLVLGAITTPGDVCLLAIGNSQFGFVRSVLRFIWMVTALPVGFYTWGLPGLVWATALSELLPVFVLFPTLAKRGLLRLHREFEAPVFFAVGAIVAWLIVSLF